MSRHNHIPPYARRVGANHPSVRKIILQEIEEDLRTNHVVEECIGYIDADGILHLYDKDSVAQEQQAEAEEDQRIAAEYKLQFLDWVAIISLALIVLTLGIGGSLWLSS